MIEPVIAPPSAAPDPVTESIHGIELTDSYRWLEDQGSSQTTAWLSKQSRYAQSYFEAIPSREKISPRVAELISGVRVSQPWKVANRYFWLQHHENNEQPVIVMRDDCSGLETTLVDPAIRNVGGSAAVDIVAISPGGLFLAYSVRESGRDYAAIEIVDIENHIVLSDGLVDGFCTGFAFAPDNSGFYYSNRPSQHAHPHYRAAFWHQFGTNPSKDQEIFLAGEHSQLYLGILVSPEANCLGFVVGHDDESPRTSLYIWSLSQEGAEPTILAENIAGCFVPFFAQGRLFAYTDLQAENYRIVEIDVNNPEVRNWRTVVSETEHRIQQYAAIGNEIFVTRVNRFTTQIQAFTIDGDKVDEIPVSPHGSVDVFHKPYTADVLFFTYTSITQPPIVFSYNVNRRALSIWDSSKVAFDASDIDVKEVSYISRDGTSVPLFLAAKKHLMHSQPRPTFVTGYGGFGSCVTPRFTAFATFLIEQGFLVAVPALRGGSELGEKWHVAGMRKNRQNAFDDFICAVEWLISEGYSAPEHIAIGGGSNAGLLVGAVITQRPDLFRAAICLGPLLDMVRYHLFDFAAVWTHEYGTPDDKGDFLSLLAYSPYHRVRDGVAYPAVLFISGGSDTRCNPMHTRKMVARLQAATSSRNPILLDYRQSWGHVPNQPFSVRVEALSNRLAFLCNELGTANMETGV